MGESSTPATDGSALQLSWQRVTDNDVARLSQTHPQLERLGLSGTLVSDDCLRYLPRTLKDLSLAHTQVTDAGLAELVLLHELETLLLAETRITDEGLHWLSQLSGLRHLWLDGTPIGSALARGNEGDERGNRETRRFAQSYSSSLDEYGGW
jgi:internalin A